MALIISPIIILILIDTSLIIAQYRRLNSAASWLSMPYTHSEIWHADPEHKIILKDWTQDLLQIYQKESGENYVETQINVYRCDNNEDRFVDDPTSFAISTGRHQKRFLGEFSFCGEIGKAISHNRYVWVFIQQQVPIYTTRLLGLKPITISHLEKRDVPTWNIVLVVDVGICVNADSLICNSLLNNNPLLDVLELPSDQVFIISAGESKNPLLQIDCSLLALSSIEENGCQSFKDANIMNGLLHAVDILNTTDKEYYVPVMILISDNSSQIDKTKFKGLVKNNYVWSHNIFVGEGDNLCKSAPNDWWCEGYNIDSTDELQTAFDYIYSDILYDLAPHGLLR